MGLKRQSWMVQHYIKLLTGRFQVRILVAEPSEVEIGHFQACRLGREAGGTTRVLAGRFHPGILVARPLNSKSAVL